MEGNCHLQLQIYSERSRNARLPSRSDHLSESAKDAEMQNSDNFQTLTPLI